MLFVATTRRGHLFSLTKSNPMACEQLATKADIQAIDARLTAIQTKLDSLPDKPFVQGLIDGLRAAILAAIAALQETTDNTLELTREVFDFRECYRTTEGDFQAG